MVPSRKCSAVLLILWGSMLVVAAQSTPHLCDDCDCLPNRMAPLMVNCKCEQKKILIFQDHYSDLMSRTTHLNISSCTFISLPRAALPAALQYVQIKNLPLFHLPPKVFPNLKRLYIDKVNELILNSFTGLPQFESLVIMRSKLMELSTDSFRSISTMKEIIFDQVYVTKIFSHGVDADFGDEEMSGHGMSRFIIRSSKISEIGANGLNLANLNLFQIVNSTVDSIQDTGLNISAQNINLTSNRFHVLSDQAFAFSSNNVQINFNEFHALPNNILNSIVTSNKVDFLNNIIYDVDLGGFLLNLDLSYVNIKYNKIFCDCMPNKVSFLKLNYNFPGIQISNETDIILNNYCYTHEQISLFEFKEYLISGSMCAGEMHLNDTLDSAERDLESSSTENGVTHGNSGVMDDRAVVLVTVAFVTLLRIL